LLKKIKKRGLPVKLQKKPNDKLLIYHHLPNCLSIGIEISKAGRFSNLFEITLPDLGIYNVIAMGGYNTRGIIESKHIVKYAGDLKFKPQFVETIFKALKEEE
jgi:hypothetical protein